MTKEEAKEVLYRTEQFGVYDQTHEAVEVANKALDQETCEDVVSRQAVLEIIEREEFKGDALSEIEKLPSVKPVACIGTVKFSKEDLKKLVDEKVAEIKESMCKAGKWLNKDASGYHFYGKCSECGQEFQVDAWYAENMNYCPNCGVKMDKE